jgi:hypothetical protein
VEAVRDRGQFLKDVFGPETRSGAAPLGQARPRYFGMTPQPLKVIQPGFLSVNPMHSIWTTFYIASAKNA